MIYRYLVTLILALLVGCTNSPSIDYTDEYARSNDDNRAVVSTQEAMNTNDVIDTLNTMLGAPDQSDSVVASNVRFIHNLDELSGAGYDRYELRVADNMRVNHDMKDGYLRRAGYDKDFDDDKYRGRHYTYDKDRYSASSMHTKLADIKDQYPRAVIALNKQDRIISVALDSLEAQALAQKDRRVFYVVKGQTLKTTINRWSKQAHWTMQWAVASDYTMVAPAVIFGEFSAQGGSLDQLLGTLRHLDQPLKAQFARNKMVVIRENTYSSNIMAVMP
jgi:hypothetical protein